MHLGVIPVTVSVGSSSVVASHDVVGVSDPDASWGLIGVEQTPGTSCVDNQIVLNEILGLSSILNEDSVAHVLVCDVVLDSEVVHTMNRHSSVVCLPDGIVSHIGVMNSTNHMEMDWVATQFEGLAYVEELNILNPSNAGFVTW